MPLALRCSVHHVEVRALGPRHEVRQANQAVTILVREQDKLPHICRRGDKESEVAHQLEEVRLDHKVILCVLHECFLDALLSDLLLGPSDVKREPDNDELAEVDVVAPVSVELLPEVLHLGGKLRVRDDILVFPADEALELGEGDPLICGQLIEGCSPLQELVVRVPELGHAVLSPREAELGPPGHDVLRGVPRNLARGVLPRLRALVPLGPPVQLAGRAAWPALAGQASCPALVAAPGRGAGGGRRGHFLTCAA
mmetsp:Transcript_80031/g.210190  ORF Transcript_80031/g.210190 Transcript_80031/m.210190 type:complete len:255 (+) Transcript_80031:249-1013(+)